MVEYPEDRSEVEMDCPPPIVKTRRRLPHWYLDGATYFVTFRLADSVPQSVLRAWREERDTWLRNNPPPRNVEQEREYRRSLEGNRQKWLDAGHGSCVLKTPEVAQIMADTLMHFDGQRYSIGDFVVMPNHVHLLVHPHSEHQLSKIVHSWKSYSAHCINKLLGRAGKLWQEESYDHIVRSEAQLAHFRRYIAENPVKARLTSGEYLLMMRESPEE